MSRKLHIQAEASEIHAFIDQMPNIYIRLNEYEFNRSFSIVFF